MKTTIVVYGWRKPTLEVTLVEGGSLLSNTKYYVLGVMAYTPFTYCAVTSPVSDVYEITTTSTAKSIQIKQTTYRDIESFSDNGDGTYEGAIYNDCLGMCLYSSSDCNIKENIEDVSFNALSVLSTVKPKNYHLKRDKIKDNNSKALGYVSQDFEAAGLPVKTDKESGIKAISHSSLIPYLHQAILELQSCIIKLENK